MKLQKFIWYIVQIVFWILCLYFFVNNSFLRYQSLDKKDEYITFALIIFIIVINQFYFIPKYFSKQKFIQYFIFVLVSILIISYLEFLLLENDIKSSLLGVNNAIINNVLRWNFFLIFFRDTLFVSFFTMFKIYRNAIKAYKLLEEKTALERINYISKIEAVKSKINTHFFFNTLNSIYSLALDKSDKTPDVVLNLSDLMEYVVADTDNEKVSLQKEIDFLKNYIAIESVKHKNMNLTFDTEGEINRCMVPPMIFESFVNNAFKYTDINNNGFIRILIHCKPEEIIFSCENSIDPRAKERVKSTGKGMVNTQNRLQLHYKDKHKLEVNQENNIFKVKLLLKEK